MRAVIGTAVAIAAVLLVSGTIAGIVATRASESLADPLLRLEPGSEGSPLAWYGSVLLLACAAALGALADRARRAGAPRWRAWFALAVLFTGLSIDEVAAVHESLSGTWLGLAAVLVLAAAALVWPLWREQPTSTRTAWAVAAIVFVGGAVGIDELTEVVLATRALTIPRVLLHGLEEAMEMAGAIVFLASLLTCLGRPATR